MDQELQLLEKMSEAADMGRDSLRQAFDKTQNDELKSTIREQMSEYDELFDTADKLLHHYGGKTKTAPCVAKINSHLTVNMQTALAEDKASKLAEMIIQGTTMGVTQMTKAIHDYEGDDGLILDWAERMVRTEQDSIEQMKKFL